MNKGYGRLVQNVPETVDGPAIGRAGGRVRIPELHLQDLTTGVIEAAEVLLDGGVMT